jgi:hypothetical protein
MPIVLQNPYTPTVPTYDKIHLDHMTVSLEKTVYAKTQIVARVRPYYQDPVTGEKSFSPDHREIVIDDAEAWAVQKAQTTGDMRGIEAANHIKAIVALLVETSTDLGSTTLV